MSSIRPENQTAEGEVLSRLMEAACDAAIRKAPHITEIPPRRLMTIKETSTYLAISEREVYNMVANSELSGVVTGAAS